MTHRTFSIIVELVAKVTGEEKTEILPHTRFQEDLGVGSLMAVEIMVAVADRFDIMVQEEDVLGVETVGDLVEIIERKRGEGD